MSWLDNLKLRSYRTQNVVLLLLLAFFLLLAMLSSPGITVTLDEPQHYHYGVFVLQGRTDRLDDSTMPVSALNALPQFIANYLQDGTVKSILNRFFVARLVTILFSALVAMLVFRWSRRLYGFAAAVFSMILYVLDPNIIAHSLLVTTDIYAVGMITLTFYLLWKFANSRSISHGLLCALSLGLSQLVKYTCIALIPIGLVALFLHDVPSLRVSYRLDGNKAIRRYLGQVMIYLVATILITVLLINIGFWFNHTFTRFGDYGFQSTLFLRIQTNAPWLSRLPIPLPYPYLQGLDLIRYRDETGAGFGNVYLLGHLRKPGGFPGYYLVASLLKVPIATQVILLASVVASMANSRRGEKFARDEVFLLAPAALFILYFNLMFDRQIGIRHYLVLFPLLYILAGTLFSSWKFIAPTWKVASISLVAYLAVSVLSYFPYFTPYFNEFVWDKTQTYKYLADSNLDWGQSRSVMEGYLVQHPEAIYDPATPRAGLLVIAGSDLVGILTKPEQYAWLRDNFKPVDTIAYAYFVYRITPEQLATLCATTNYCK